MTLGGVDQTIHSRPGIQYVKMKEMNNWFQVIMKGRFILRDRVDHFQG